MRNKAPSLAMMLAAGILGGWGLYGSTLRRTTSFTGDPTPSQQARFDSERIAEAKERRSRKAAKKVANIAKSRANSPH